MPKTEKEKKKAKRLAEYRYWIKKFQHQARFLSKDSDITFIANAAEILNDVYWALVENYVRPLVDDRNETDDNGENNISRFKIISTTELTVMRVRPVIGNNEETERLLNAHFAYYIAITILRSYDKELKDESFKFLDGYKEVIDNIPAENILAIRTEHIQWLAYLDTRSEMPIISNAQTWRLYNLCLLALENKLHEPKTKSTRKKTGRHS
jgi:hypothetical protein